MRKHLMAALVAAVALVPWPASAGDWYVHNGSLMDAGFTNAGEFVVLYSRPKWELSHLVLPGTLLISGRVDSMGWFSGVSHRFKTGCSSLRYNVSGLIRPNQSFVLSGPAAKYRGCFVGGYDWQGRDPQSTLPFIFVGTGPQPPAVSF